MVFLLVLSEKINSFPHHQKIELWKEQLLTVENQLKNSSPIVVVCNSYIQSISLNLLKERTVIDKVVVVKRRRE